MNDDKLELIGLLVFLLVLKINPNETISAATPQIYMHDNINNQLNAMWDKYNGSEFLTCLNVNNATIDYKKDVTITLSNETQVRTSEYCPPGTNLQIHSHTNGYPALSDWDLKESMRVNYLKPYITYYAVMWDHNSYSIYNIGNLSKRILYGVITTG